MRVKMTKALSLLLCLLMLVNMLPVSALASEATPDEPSAQTEQQPAECQHTGGSATCKALAVCDNCKQSYGEYAAHSGGTATCTALAVCETCGEGYGALAEHSYSAGVCTACNGADPDYVPPCEHTGGTATCTAQAVCTVCAAAYGELADHSYDNGVCSCGEVCSHAEYAEGKCTLCGAAQPEVVCTCETDDPAYHAPFCALYERTGDACLCEVECTEENHNIYCEVCYFDGIAACTGGEEDQIPYTTGSCGDGVTYTLAGGTLTISGTGAMQNWLTFSRVPWYDTCASITTVTIGDGVTSIGNWAFYDCSRLINVEIPNSVTSIGEDAFRKCGALTSVVIPGFVTSIGDRAFLNCSSLTNVEIPDSVKSIGEDAFESCTSLKNVTIGNSVESIGEKVFYRCSSLTSVEIPASVKSIGKYAFGHCTSLENVTIGNSVESIGDYAFYHCNSLTKVEIPDSVKSIGEGAFGYCTSLKNVTIGNSVKSIGKNAFCNCSSLTSVTIPNSVTGIGDGAFERCSALKSVNAPCKCTVYGPRLYNGQKLLYTFDDGVTITLAEHKALDTGSCICGYNPIAFVKVTGDPISWGYAPDATATLTATVAPTKLSNATYVWEADGETVPNETSSTLTLTGLDAGDHSYTCTATVDGYTKTSKPFTVSVDKADSSVIAAPTGRSLTYSGEGQYLINTGNASGGTMQYSLDGKSYSKAIPQGTAVGDYTVYYKVVGDENHNDTTADSVTATIAQRSITLTANDQTIFYSGALTENDVTVDTLASGDTLDSVTLTPSTTNVTDNGTVTPSAAVIKDGNNDVTANYAITYIPGTLTINKSSTSISFNGYAPGKIYDGVALANPTEDELIITGAFYSDVFFSWSEQDTDMVQNSTPIDAGTYYLEVSIHESENTTPSSALLEDITVSPREVSEPIITLESSSYEYDGTEKKPTVTVEYDGKVIPASEYTVSYSNNINAGTATVTITDKPGGNYIVSGSTHFTIKPCVITVSGITAKDKVYDGSTFAYLGDGEPSYSNIPEGEDPRFVIQVALSYDSAAAGEDKPISIEVVDVGVADGYNANNYILVADKIYADIRPKDISVAESCEFSLAETSFVYSGEAPELTVTGVDSSVGNTPLTENTDYTVGTAQINAGSHTLTVTGKGNYTGTVELHYTIHRSTSRIQFKDFNPTWTYTGEEFPNPMASHLTITGAGYKDVRFTWYRDGEPIFGNPIDAGTYKVVAEIPESENTHRSEALAENIIVKPLTAAVPTITLDDKIHDYDGTAKTPAVTVKYEGKTIPASEYTVSYSDNISAGTATVTITDKDGGNYIVSGSAQFTIKVREIIVRGLRVSDKVYDGTTTAALDYSGVTYENMPSADGFAITKLELAAKFLNADAGENKPVELTFAGLEVSQGFDVYSIAITIPDAFTASIQKRPITLTADSFSKTYGEADPNLTYQLTKGQMVGSDALTGALSRDAGENAGEYAITIGTLANPNYDITFIPGKLTITKADAHIISEPQPVSGLNYSGEKQALVTDGTASGGTMQYALGNDGSTAPTDGWSTEIPTATNAGTYYVWFMVKGDSNHKDTQAEYVTVSIAKADASDSMKQASGILYKDAESTVALPELPSTNMAHGTPSFSEPVVSASLDADKLIVKGSAEVVKDGSYTVTVPVDGGDNYNDYVITVSLTGREHEHVWTYSVSGTTITAKCSGTIGSCSVADKTVTLTLTAPTALTYDGQKKVVTVTQSPAGVFDDIPAEVTDDCWTDVGSYTASLTYGEKTATLEFTIDRATPTVQWDNTAASVDYTGSMATVTAPKVTLVNGETFNGNISYSYTGTSSGNGLPTNAGTYEITASIDAQGNYNAATSTNKLTLTINKVASSCTAPVAVSGLIFNDGNQNLITAGTATGGTMQYRLSQNESYTATIPTGKDAGTYTVYYKVAGDSNHNDTVEATVTVTIAKAAAPAAKIPLQKHFHDYATANTLALSQYLPVNRGETTYTLGTITGNFFADGTAVTETGSLTYSTRVMDAAATGSIAVNVVMENYEDVTLTVPVELVAVTAQTETRIVKNGLTEVPAGLANTGFNTLEKLKAEQQRVLALRLGQDPQSSIAHYDVKLQFSPDGGKTWVDATEENFPAGGLTVTLPYPSGTGKDSHKFVVSHMFTTGNKAGTTETPAVTKTAEGIQFTVTGLSPVSVAWSAIPFDVNIATVTNGTVYVSPAHTTAGTQVTITVTPKSGYKLSTLTVKDAAGNSYAVSTDNNGKYYFTMPAANVTVTATFSRISTATADPTNPKTGDDFGVIFWSGMMMTSLSGLAALVLGKKKFYRR